MFKALFKTAVVFTTLIVGTDWLMVSIEKSKIVIVNAYIFARTLAVSYKLFCC